MFRLREDQIMEGRSRISSVASNSSSLSNSGDGSQNSTHHKKLKRKQSSVLSKPIKIAEDLASKSKNFLINRAQEKISTKFDKMVPGSRASDLPYLDQRFTSQSPV